jgi:putative copper resistance protein D
VEAFAVAVRWLHFTGATVLVGVFAFLLVIARPASRAAGPDGMAMLEGLDRRLLGLARWMLAATVAASGLDLWRQTAVATGAGLGASLAPTALGAVLLTTQYGAVWLTRQALLVLAGGLLLLADEPRDARDWHALRLQAGGMSALSLSIIGAASHAASAQELPGLAIVVDAVHLLATGVWLGALGPLAILLHRTRGLPEPVGTALAAGATRRFSRLGLASVLALIASGTFNSWAQVNSVPALVGTAYGRWLLLKVGLLLPLVAIAAVNHFVLKPALVAAATTGRQATRVVGRLRRHVIAELALGAAILAVVAVLGLTTPARHDQVSWPLTYRLSWDATRSLPGVQTRVAIGSQMALFGFVAALLAAILKTRRWPVVLGAGAVAAVAGALVALPPLAVDAYPTTYLRPTVTYTAGSIVEGAEVFRSQCAVCHGEHGYGDGPAASGLRPRPADLTARHTADHTAGDMFWWLTHGIPGSAMPGFADRLSVDQRWDLINLIRILASAERARPMGPEIVPVPWLVGPDFTYTRGVGETRNLKDYRAERIVVLVLFTLPGSGPRLSQLQAAYGPLVRAGAEVLGIPVRSRGNVYRDLGNRPVAFPIAVDGAAEAAEAYRYLRPEPEEPAPDHLEFLIDRQGYVRARWSPAQGEGWSDPERLVAQVQRLAREPERAPAPAEHVH